MAGGLLFLLQSSGCSSILFANRIGMISDKELLFHVWGPGYVNETVNVKLYMCYLRKKLEEDPENPKYIWSTKGVWATAWLRDPRTSNGKLTS